MERLKGILAVVIERERQWTRVMIERCLGKTPGDLLGHLLLDMAGVLLIVSCSVRDSWW